MQNGSTLNGTHNDGIEFAGTALTTVSGDQSVTTPGVYQNVRVVNGTLNVLACGVTIHNVEVDGGVPPAQDPNHDRFGIWLHQQGCGATVDHTTVIAEPGTIMDAAVRDAYGAPETVRSVKIINAQDGFVPAAPDADIEDSFVQNGSTLNGTHNDGIEFAGTACLFGQNGDVVINPTVIDNYLAGGGYVVYGGLDSTTATPPRGVLVQDNVFGQDFFPQSGYYGAASHWYAPGSAWLNNHYSDGTPVPSP